MSGLLGSAPLGAVVPGSLYGPAQEKSSSQAGQEPAMSGESGCPDMDHPTEAPEKEQGKSKGASNDRRE